MFNPELHGFTRPEHRAAPQRPHCHSAQLAEYPMSMIDTRVRASIAASGQTEAAAAQPGAPALAAIPAPLGGTPALLQRVSRRSGPARARSPASAAALRLACRVA